MEILRKTGFLSLIFLAIISAVVDIAYGFFCFFWKNTTEDVFNINDQTPVDIKEVKDSKKLSDDEIKKLEDRKLFEVNLYSNLDTPKSGQKNGIVLEELKINHFIDSSLSASSIISSGMQYVSDYDGRKGLYVTGPTLLDELELVANGHLDEQAVLSLAKKGGIKYFNKEVNKVYTPAWVRKFKSEKEANDYICTEGLLHYECAGLGGATWNAMGLQTKLNRNTELIVRIADDAYKIKLDKYLDTTYDNRPQNWWSKLAPWNWSRWGDYGGYIHYYNWDNVFEDIMHGVLSCNLQTGTHYAAVNLSNYFTVTEHYNIDKEQWEPASEADQQVAYAVVKYNYHTSGAVSNVQSMFGVIADDPRFKVNEDTYDTDFGQAVVRIELTEDSFEKRYSETYGGYFLSLSADLKRRLSEMPPHIIDVFFTEGSMVSECKKRDDYPIVGFDANALDGVEIRSLDINWCLVGSDADFKFYLLNNSLRGTGLTAEKITANHEKLVNLSSGVEL